MDDILDKIKEAKAYYEYQCCEVEHQEYIRDSLLDSYIRTVKKQDNTYDYMDWHEIEKELKDDQDKNKKHLTLLKEYLARDFFQWNKDFTITKILSYGYEGYMKEIVIMKNNIQITLDIPMFKNINKDNFRSACNGMHRVEVKDKCFYSYDISEIAEKINLEVNSGGVKYELL